MSYSPYFIIYILTITLNIFLMLFVLFKNLRNRLNLTFTLLMGSITGWVVTLFLFYNLNDPKLVLFFGRLNFSVTELLGFFIFIFFYLFPKKIYQLKKPVKILLGLELVVLLILTQFTPLIDKDEIIRGESRTTVYGPLYFLFVAHFMIYCVAGSITLFAKLRRFRGLARYQILYVLWGFFLALGFGTLTNILIPAAFGYYDVQNLGPLATVVLGAFLAYAVVKHRLFDIRLVVARTVAWALLIFILEVFYIFLILNLTRVFYGGVMNSWQVILNGVLTLITAVTFHPLRRLLERITDSIFFKDRYDTEDFLKAMGRVLGSTLEIEPLVNKLLTRLLTEMKLNHACLVILKGHKIEHIFSQNCQQEAVSYQQIRSILTSAQRPLIFDELPEGKRKNLLRQLDIGFTAPLHIKDKGLGLLVLGHKLSGDIYFDQDIQVLSILTSEVAVAIQNALSYEEIKKFSNTLKLEIDKATIKIKNTNKRLKELSDLKDEFVSVASHEMRTPMTIIKGYLSMLLEGDAGELSSKAKDLISDAFEGATRMIRLVNNMLNVSRIESGRISVNLQDVQLEKICEDVVDEFRIEAREHGLKLKFETLGTNEPLPKVRVDIDRIREVLVNLVANAIKFTPHGHIFVRCQVKDDLLLTEIEDTGVGIPKEARKKLFRKFSQASLRDAQERKGSGLGLYICQLMINEFGGKIWFHSKVGKGTTFFFVLPTVKPR